MQGAATDRVTSGAFPVSGYNKASSRLSPSRLKMITYIRKLIFSLFLGLLIQSLLSQALSPHLIEAGETDAREVIDWDQTADQVWLGKELWANPMEDWRVKAGRIECLSGAANRNIHLLTYELARRSGSFEMEVTVGLMTPEKKNGAAGFAIGVQDEIDDYRARCLRGRRIECGLQADGVLFLGPKREKLDCKWSDSGVRLLLKGNVSDQQKQGTLSLQAFDPVDNKPLAPPLKLTPPSGQLYGNVALLHNPPRSLQKKKIGSRFWFDNWTISGDKFSVDTSRAFGPILWAMHTLSDSRGVDGHVLKMTAQLPPIANLQDCRVELHCKSGDDWKQCGQSAKIDAASRSATIRVRQWPKQKDVPYQLRLISKNESGLRVIDRYEGTIRRDPVDHDLVVAGFTGNTDYGFPNLEIVKTVSYQNPDLLFFSGDQIYENVGGYGIIRKPVDRAILNYLRKWYLFGWAFRDLMRDRPTICLPDDHDVYQGNIWGNGGNPVATVADHDKGGYVMHPDFVNVVHRTQCSHHPDFYDPRPIKQNISVFYGDMVYGRISFAIIADRMFKSGPAQVATWPGRPDHLKDPNYDVKKLDKPGLKLLGDRQLKFLNEWATDWRSADMKSVLSATIFCNLANYHGPNKMFLVADLDSNGWPQTARDKAVRALRKGFAFHLAGDQHLASIVHQGIDAPGDSIYSFCVPSIAAGYPRSWLPDMEGKPVKNRPDPNLPNTGDYIDAFGHPITVYAIGNPALKNRPGRINTLHDKASGHGIVRFHRQTGEISMECYRLQVDPENLKPSDQFPGWPKRISYLDNYARQAWGYLPEIKVKNEDNPVIQVVNEQTGEIEYTVRIRGNHWQPKVFEPGRYKIRVGSPERNSWVHINHANASLKNDKSIVVRLPR